MQPQFTKFHGLGNDYLVFETEQLHDIENLGDFARRICNRHYGAGGDGIAIIGKLNGDEADFMLKHDLLPAPINASLLRVGRVVLPG